MTAVTDARLALGELVLAARSLALRIADAEEVQWSPAPRPRPTTSPDEPTIRGKGGPPADPTAAVVFDEPRLALRSAVRRAEHELGLAIDRVVLAEREVERALDAWQGE